MKVKYMRIIKRHDPYDKHPKYHLVAPGCSYFPKGLETVNTHLLQLEKDGFIPISETFFYKIIA